MKRIALIAALAFASQAGWAQDKPAAAAAQPAPQPAAQEPAKPAPEAKAPGKAANNMKKTSKRNEDARRCLELEGNTAIIKCAEEFL